MRTPRTDHEHPAARRIARSLAGLLVAAAVSLTLIAPAAAHACPSCYGAASGPVIDGMNVAVLLMVGVTGGVLSWIVAFALRIVRRERGDGR